MSIEADDFDQWRANPVTIRLMEILDIKAQEARETWFRRSWEGGNADPVLLADLRARATALEQVRHIAFEDMDTE